MQRQEIHTEWKIKMKSVRKREGLKAKVHEEEQLAWKGLQK